MQTKFGWLSKAREYFNCSHQYNSKIDYFKGHENDESFKILRYQGDVFFGVNENNDICFSSGIIINKHPVIDNSIVNAIWFNNGIIIHYFCGDIYFYDVQSSNFDLLAHVENLISITPLYGKNPFFSISLLALTSKSEIFLIHSVFGSDKSICRNDFFDFLDKDLIQSVLRDFNVMKEKLTMYEDVTIKPYTKVIKTNNTKQIVSISFTESTLYALTKDNYILCSAITNFPSIYPTEQQICANFSVKYCVGDSLELIQYMDHTLVLRSNGFYLIDQEYLVPVCALDGKDDVFNEERKNYLEKRKSDILRKKTEQQWSIRHIVNSVNESSSKSHYQINEKIDSLSKTSEFRNRTHVCRQVTMAIDQISQYFTSFQYDTSDIALKKQLNVLRSYKEAVEEMLNIINK